MTPYVLHYAPDNASLVIRLVLEELGVPYSTTLVDRTQNAQRSDAYKSLNPVGRIPALETPHGPIFETAAIALWLADTHRDSVQLSPEMSAANRARFLSVLFFISNTVHAELRSLFYPTTLVGRDPDHCEALRAQTRKNLVRHYRVLEQECAKHDVLGSDTLNVADIYAVATLRWPSVYPVDADRNWMRFDDYPNLAKLAAKLESRPSTAVLSKAEGLGNNPFTNPQPPNPPEGVAI